MEVSTARKADKMTEQEYEQKIKDLERRLANAERWLGECANVALGMANWGEKLANNEFDTEANREACGRLFRMNQREWNRIKGMCLPKPKPLAERVYPKGHYHGD